MRTPAERASLVLSASVALCFGICAVTAIWRQSFIAIDGKRYFNLADDALVTLRYGWNLAHGHGLVWNPGERVEGISNLAWALYSAVLALVLDKRLLPLGIQLTAVVLLVTTAFAFRQIFRRMTRIPSTTGYQAVVDSMAMLIPLCHLPLVIWSLFGMESSLVAVLFALALSAMLGTASSLRGSALLGAAFLARPDTLIPSVIVLGARLFRRLANGVRPWSRQVEVLPFIGFVLAGSSFRYQYYGSIVPNTYVLKVSGMPLLDRVQQNGIPYITPFLGESRVLIGVLLVSLVLRPKFDKLVLASLPVSMVAYSVYVGGDAFPDWRFLAPFVPYASLVVLSDCPALVDHARAYFVSGRIARALPLVIVTAASILFLVSAWRQPFRVALSPQPDNVANTNTAIFLSRVLKPEASVGVFYAGAIPYYTGLQAVDFLGKCDPHVARLPPDTTGAISWSGLRSVPGHNKYDLHYSILQKRPTYVAGLKWGRQDVTGEGLEYYDRVPVDFLTGSDFDLHVVLLLKDSKDVDWQRVRN